MIHFCITCENEEGEIQYLDHTRKQENRKLKMFVRFEKKNIRASWRKIQPRWLSNQGPCSGGGAALGAMLFPLEFSRQFPYPQNLKKEGKMGKNMEKEDKSGEKGKN